MKVPRSGRLPARVLASIEQLGFRPSPTAQRLSTGRTMAIGVIAPFLTRPSCVERLRGIEARLADSDYDMIVYNVESPACRDDYFEQLPLSQRVDGIIVISMEPSDEVVEGWRIAGTPVVLVDTNHPLLSYINTDDLHGGLIATEYLISLGHRRIAFVSEPVDDPFGFRANRCRYDGYLNALAAHGIQPFAEYNQQGQHSRPNRPLLMTRHLLELDSPPSAIFATSDTQAFAVMETIREMGLQIPRDLSVIGFDDIELAGYLGLTTVRQPLFQTGWRGAELMMELLELAQAPLVQERLDLTLIVRNTTAAHLSFAIVEEREHQPSSSYT